MKRRFLLKLFFIVILCCTISTSFAKAQTETDSKNSKTIKAVIQSDSPPTYFKDRVTGEASGFAADVTNAIARRGGFKITYLFEKNWESIAPLIESGKADIAPGQGITEDRAEIAAFTLPIGTFPVSIFARANNSAVSDVKDIKTIGVTKGSSSSEILKKKYPAIIVVTYESNANGLMDLLSGHIDAFCTSATTLIQVASDAGLETKVKIVGEPLAEIKRAIAIRKDDSELLNNLNALIEDFSRTPEYKAIYSKWYGTPHLYWTGRKVLIVIVAIIFFTIVCMAFWHYRSIIRLNRILQQKIAELQQAENKIEQHAAEWQKTFDAIPSSVFLRNADGLITQCNIATEQITGKSKNEIIGRYCWEIMHCTSEPIPGCPIPVMNNSQKRETMVLSIGDKWYQVYVDPMLDNGKVIGAVHTMEDITNRRNAEKALQESEERFRSAFEHAAIGFSIYSPKGHFIQVNPALCNMLGYSEEELKTKTFRDITHPDDLSSNVDQVNQLLSGTLDVLQFQKRYIHKLGHEVWASLSVSVVRDETGTQIYLIALIENITEHQRLEAQLRQAQKMESVGTLAGGIAHDFNNILSAIVGYGSLSLMKMAEDDPNRLNVQHILEASEKAAQLTKDLLLFSRKQSIDRKPLDINEIIGKLKKFLIRVIGEDIAFNTRLLEKKLLLSADSHQLEQVLMNLTTNARDAMPNGGTFTITTEEVLLGEEFTSTRGLSKPGRYALISISDTGSGMDKETTEKIFEPFFTTKEVGKGTGLGLAVSYGIIKQHDGHISVYSEKRIGTTFRIYLPLLESAETEDEEAITEVQPIMGGTETILIAEDEEMLRKLNYSVLKEYGYTVIDAVDGVDAVNKYREHKDRIRLLLFDLVMPRMNGSEAYDEIRKINPDIKVIFASGYSPDIVRQKVLLNEDVELIYKPVSPFELLRKIREVLDKGKR